MRPDRPAARGRRQTRFAPEALEGRALLTGGAGNNFAIINTDIVTANAKVTVPFTIDPKVVTLTAKHQITIGVDVAAQSGSSVVPRVVGIEDMQTHQMLPVTRGTYAKSVQIATPQEGRQTTAVLVTLKLSATQAASPHQYAAIVQGKGGTTGQMLVGFYLPGDSNGDGTVDATDIAAIKSDLNVNANSSNYVFADDANRDGVINNSDLKVALANLGAAVTITPVVSANLNAASDSGVQDRITNIQDVEFDGTTTPYAKVTYTDTNNTAPATSTVADMNGKYSIHIPLGNGSNIFQVTSTDAFGQTVSGQISPVTYSLTAPTAATASNVPTTPTANLASSSSGGSSTS